MYIEILYHYVSYYIPGEWLEWLEFVGSIWEYHGDIMRRGYGFTHGRLALLLQKLLNELGAAKDFQPSV